MAKMTMTDDEMTIATSYNMTEVDELYQNDHSINLVANGKDGHWWIPHALPDYAYMSKKMRQAYAKRFLRAARHLGKEHGLLEAARDAVQSVSELQFINLARGIVYCLEGDLDIDTDVDWHLVEQLDQIRSPNIQRNEASQLQATCVEFLKFNQVASATRQKHLIAIAHYLMNIEQYVEQMPIPLPDELVHRPTPKKDDLVVYFDKQLQLHIGVVSVLTRQTLYVITLPHSEDYCGLTTVIGSKRNQLSPSLTKYRYGHATEQTRIATEPIDVGNAMPWRVVEYYRDHADALTAHLKIMRHGAGNVVTTAILGHIRTLFVE